MRLLSQSTNVIVCDRLDLIRRYCLTLLTFVDILVALMMPLIILRRLENQVARFTTRRPRAFDHFLVLFGPEHHRGVPMTGMIGQ
jgi:hypothetical protein